MVDAANVVISFAVLLPVFLQSGIGAQSPNSSATQDHTCAELRDKWEFQVVENVRLRGKLERDLETIKTLESISSVQTAQIRLLKRKNRRLQKLLRRNATATFIASLYNSRSDHGIAKIGDKIYVLDNRPSPNRIKVYEDRSGFSFLTSIPLNGTEWSNDIIYNNSTKSFYISDFAKECIWVMSTGKGEQIPTKWLDNVPRPNTLSLSNEGHLLVLKQSQTFAPDTLEIYALNGSLIRILQLPREVGDPRHVVQKPNGNFIVSHRQMNTSSVYEFAISQLTNDGHVINSFIPRNDSERMNYPVHMALDADNNRLFVADYYKYRVIVFDSIDLTWSQVLLNQESNGIRTPFRLFYDAKKRHLFVVQHANDVNVYQID